MGCVAADDAGKLKNCFGAPVSVELIGAAEPGVAEDAEVAFRKLKFGVGAPAGGGPQTGSLVDDGAPDVNEFDAEEPWPRLKASFGASDVPAVEVAVAPEVAGWLLKLLKPVNVVELFSGPLLAKNAPPAGWGGANKLLVVAGLPFVPDNVGTG